MTNKTPELLLEDLYKALSDNSLNVSTWLSDLGDSAPDKALNMYDKIAGTYMKLSDFNFDGGNDKEYNITIEVESEEDKKVLEELIKDNGAFIDNLLMSNDDEFKKDKLKELMSSNKDILWELLKDGEEDEE